MPPSMSRSMFASCPTLTLFFFILYTAYSLATSKTGHGVASGQRGQLRAVQSHGAVPLFSNSPSRALYVETGVMRHTRHTLPQTFYLQQTVTCDCLDISTAPSHSNHLDSSFYTCCFMGPLEQGKHPLFLPLRVSCSGPPLRFSVFFLASSTPLRPDNFRARVLELNASDEHGISIVPEMVKNFACQTPRAETIASDGPGRWAIQLRPAVGRLQSESELDMDELED
jgi:hypothetical protein